MRNAALEELQPADVLGGAERFDKVFAMHVNLFWVRSPTSVMATPRVVKES